MIPQDEAQLAMDGAELDQGAVYPRLDDSNKNVGWPPAWRSWKTARRVVAKIVDFQARLQAVWKLQHREFTNAAAGG